MVRRAAVPCFVFWALLAGVAAAQNTAADFASKMRDADALLERQQWEDALRIYKAANALENKKSALAQLGMARAYQGSKAHKNAVEACDDALEHTGGDKALEATIRNVRGVSLFALAGKADDKRWKRAEEDFRAVLASTTEHPIARFNLGLTLLKQLRDEEGVGELKTFVETSANAKQAAEAKRYIDDPRRARAHFAPDFSFTTLAGERLSSDDLRGKVVLVDFWATWCKPCVAATPGLKRIQDKFGGEPFVIVGVSADRDQSAWRAFVEKNKLSWPQFHDGRRTVGSAFQVDGYPTYILIDHEGIIQFRQEGWSPGVDGKIEGEARSLIRKAKAAQAMGGQQ